MTENEVRNHINHYDHWCAVCRRLGLALVSWDSLDSVTVRDRESIHREPVTLPYWLTDALIERLTAESKKSADAVIQAFKIATSDDGEGGGHENPRNDA